MKAGRIGLLPVVVIGLLAGLSLSRAGPSGARQAGPAAAPLLALVPHSNPHPAHRPLDVDVTVDGVLDLGAFQMDLVFDPAFVALEGVGVAPFLGLVTACDPNLARCAVPLGPALSGSRARFGAATYGAPPGPTGNGVVAVIHLRPTGAVGSTLLVIESAVLADVDAAPTIPATQNVTLLLRPAVYLPVVLRN